MAMYSIEITDVAQQDILQAVQYIAVELQNSEAAHSLLNAIDTTILSLQERPRRFSLVRDELLAKSGFRVFPLKKYLIFYRVVENKVIIQRFLYGKRSWENVLKQPEGEQTEN